MIAKAGKTNSKELDRTRPVCHHKSARPANIYGQKISPCDILHGKSSPGRPGTC